MTPLSLALVATGLIAATGVLALFAFRVPRVATSLAALGAVAGGAIGFWASVAVLRSDFAAELAVPWAIPGGGLVVGIDPLSAFFLAPLFALGALCAVYGRCYLGPLTLPGVELNLLLATMTLVLLARHALLFLVAWEAMTLVAYLLVTFDHGQDEVRSAGVVYLIASHLAVVALLALFLALGARAGGALEFASFAAAERTPPAGAAGLLVLAVVGFGVKAGVVGLHVWLPDAHAAAPSHVSALMSAVMVKLGLYGILRTVLLVAPGAWFGMLLMILGIGGALLGIALALGQRDLKRILAYSSVENVGIILTGLGLGLWARARGDGPLATLALGGALLHLWNHAAMKGLLFLGAGNIVHATGTRDIERLGGLLSRMRWTGRAMILGAVAIAGLPPLNGFTGEWLLYRGLAQVGLSGAMPSNLAAMAGAGALALAGGLAALCFVRLVGVVLLGSPRGEAAAGAHEAAAAMTVPMWILAGGCIASCLLAPALVSAQRTVLAQLGTAGGSDMAVGTTGAADMLVPIAVLDLVLFVAIAGLAALLVWRVTRSQAGETWGCGYPAPTARMQISGRGFSELVGSRALPRWARARLRLRPAEGVFPTAATFTSDLPDPLVQGGYRPLLVRTGHQFARLRILQQGNLHIYLLYMLAAVVTGLGWVAARDWMAW